MFEHEYDEIGERMGHAERSKIFRALDLSESGVILKHDFIRGLEAGVRHIKAEERHEPVIVVKNNTEKLREIFKYYCNFGDRFKEEMSISSFTKMIRDCDLKHPKQRADLLLDGTNLALGDLGIIFNTAARFQVTHLKYGNQTDDMVMMAQLAKGSKHARVSYRITFDTMLYALRLLCEKRWPKMTRKGANKKEYMKKLLREHLFPIYDDDIAHARSSFASTEARFNKNLKKYRETFLEAKDENGDPCGANVFFEKHGLGLKSIYKRYASLDAATADNENPELQYIATSSWEDVKEVNSTMDWLEFSAFLQDFGIVPKLANRIYCERVFITFSSTAFEWHDREGHVTKETEDETHLEAMKFEGFKHCLGFLSMVLFDKDYIRSQCPTPNSKLELLFFKAKRPKWLLHASEKRMTSKVDSAVRATVMRDVRSVFEHPCRCICGLRS